MYIENRVNNKITIIGLYNYIQLTVDLLIGNAKDNTVIIKLKIIYYGWNL